MIVFFWIWYNTKKSANLSLSNQVSTDLFFDSLCMLIGRYCNPCDSILLKQTASIFNFGSKGCKLPASELNDGCSIVKCLKCLLLRFQKKPKTNAKKTNHCLKKSNSKSNNQSKNKQTPKCIYMWLLYVCFVFFLAFVSFVFVSFFRRWPDDRDLRKCKTTRRKKRNKSEKKTKNKPKKNSRIFCFFLVLVLLFLLSCSDWFRCLLFFF